MRTTVTLHEDLAIRLEQLRHERGTNFKAVLNDVLRTGLEAMHQPPAPRPEGDYTGTFPGRLLTAELGDVSR